MNEAIETTWRAATAVVAGLAKLVGGTWDAIAKDPALARAASQGADELGQALKAFPDSIHSSISAAPERASYHELYGRQAESTHVPSPSDIIRDRQASVPQKDAGREHGHSHGMG